MRLMVRKNTVPSFSFAMKRVEMDSDDSCIALWMYLISLKCTLKNGKDGKLDIPKFKTTVSQGTTSRKSGKAIHITRENIYKSPM